MPEPASTTNRYLEGGGTNADVRWYEVDVPKLSSVFEEDDGPGPTGRDKTQCLERWTIDPAAAKVLADLLDDQSQDFCRINESLLGSPHRYGYTTAIGADLPYDDARFAVLDAQDVAAPPVAEVCILRRVPFGFHGNWVPD